MLPQITTHKTSYDVWISLQDIFNTKSKSHILQLNNQLQTFKMESLSSVDYVARLTTMAEELHKAGISVDDNELMMIILNGLDQSYGSFVTTHTTRVDDSHFPHS